MVSLELLMHAVHECCFTLRNQLGPRVVFDTCDSIATPYVSAQPKSQTLFASAVSRRAVVPSCAPMHQTEARTDG